MKKLTIVGGILVALGVVLCLVVSVLTVPLIERHESKGNIRLTDHRLTFHDGRPADRLYEMRGGKWYRLPLDSDNGIVQYSLRGNATSYVVVRGSVALLDSEIETAYNQQSVFDRVWIWQLRKIS